MTTVVSQARLAKIAASVFSGSKLFACACIIHSHTLLWPLQVGKGHKDYESACQALRSWKHTHLGWVFSNAPAVQTGSNVCLAARCICMWIRNPLKIVYVHEGQLPAAPAGRGWLGRRRHNSAGKATLPPVITCTSLSDCACHAAAFQSILSAHLRSTLFSQPPI